MRLIPILILSVGSGCASTQYYAGLGAHSEHLDAPEIGLENPLGFFGFNQSIKKEAVLGADIGVHCGHVSGLLVEEDGFGLTYCGPTLYW